MRDIISIKDFYFSYPDGTHALKNINLTVCEKETVGIIGANGAGKSTLLLCINGILRGKGHIMVDGMEINDKNIFAVRKTAGIVFQDPNDQLFTPTVYEDVAFGPAQMDLKGDEIESRVEKALADIGMTDTGNRMSHHMSFGEKKKIALATVLSMSPKIFLMDEPTSNLDPDARRNFIELIKSINATKIIATHDLELVADLCGRVMVLDKGEVIPADRGIFSGSFIARAV